MINQRDLYIKLFKHEFYFLWILKFKKFKFTSFKTSKVNNYELYVFFCINLNNVYLSSFDTKNVINMINIFWMWGFN